jgi:hypothetical protein
MSLYCWFCREVGGRDWTASYTDLCVLTSDLKLDLDLLSLLTECCLKLTSVCLTAYAASVLTLLGSAALLNQTPLGPAAVHHSFRLLLNAPAASGAAADSSSAANRSATTSSEAVGSVRPADLLAASLLVASLTAASAEEGGEQGGESVDDGFLVAEGSFPRTDLYGGTALRLVPFFY